MNKVIEKKQSKTSILIISFAVICLLVSFPAFFYSLVLSSKLGGLFGGILFISALILLIKFSYPDL